MPGSTPFGPPAVEGPPPPVGAVELYLGLKAGGVDFAVYLPDGTLPPVERLVRADPEIQTVQCAREDEGIAICCGAFYGGVPSAMLMANSGFMLTPYTVATLAMFHRIPLLMLISHRGTLGERAQFQEYQGLLTEPILRAMGITAYTIDRRERLPMITEALRYTRIFKRPIALLLEGELHRPMTPIFLDSVAPG